MAQRRQTDAGLNAGRRVVLTRLVPAAGALTSRAGASVGLARLASLVGLAGGTAGGLAACAGPRQALVPAASVNGGPFILPMPAPAPRLGERWVYREINEYNKSTVGQLERVVISLAPLTVEQSRSQGAASPLTVAKGTRALTFDGAWSVLTDASFDDEYHFSPAVPLLPPRLEPGATLATSHRFRIPGNSGLYVWRQRITATGAEIIETPAGRFDTLVVRREIAFDSPDPFLFDRTRQETSWYAPAVNGFVRRTWTGSYLNEGSLDMVERRREDWVTLELVRHLAAEGQPGR